MTRFHRLATLVLSITLFACGAAEDAAQIQKDERDQVAAPATNATQAEGTEADQSVTPEEDAPLALCAPRRLDGCTYIFNLPKTRSCPVNCTGYCPNPVDPKCSGKRCYCEAGGGGL